MMDRLPPFDLIDLRLLLAMSEHRHFARAAAACGLSQPALSARIRRLEAALATPLIFRGKRFEGFTPEGERILVWARRILSDCGGLVQDVAVSGSPSGVLRLGVVPSAAPYAGRLCGRLARIHPRITFRVLSLSSSAIEAGLADFSLDAGLTYLAEGTPADCKAFPIYEETYCLVAAQNVDLKATNATKMTWSQAAELPLCLLTPDMQNRRIIEAAFAQAGKTPETPFESNSFNAILALVRDGGFATILPRLQVDAGLSEGLQVLDLVDPDARAKLGILVPQREPALPVTSALVAAIPDIA
ncbi:LysR family transcriptional regulator [Roseibium polysiphoniae]|uniref:LysR family transcriptional regulator n=1 Tax=Roseibium polysiphoniae TaxID=2571221 RepID=A0ABR9CH54_9HYPH|nr:LysR substrate-binding domain-containing protein [Roseibium polysiphoniae]MBD8878451.1 LysR family transcriptional regulator [Roseibium polysiphoniae]